MANAKQPSNHSDTVPRATSMTGWHLRTYSTSQQRLSKRCHGHIKGLPFLRFSLLHTSTALQGETYIPHDATTFQLAAHDDCCVHYFTPLLLMRLEWISQRTEQQKIQFFLAAGPFVFVAIEILGPLPRAMTENNHIVIISDWFSELTRVSPTSKVNWTQMATEFPNS